MRMGFVFKVLLVLIGWFVVGCAGDYIIYIISLDVGDGVFPLILFGLIGWTSAGVAITCYIIKSLGIQE